MKHWYDRTSVQVIFHLLFLLAMWYFFGCNCWLRTAAYPDLYKEYLSGIIAIMVIYLNYYLLFPKFYTQRKYNLYWCLSVLSVVISGAAEMVMVAPNLLNIYSKSGYTDLATNFLLKQSFLVTLRNGGLVLFAYALNTILWLQRTEEERKFDLRKQFGLLDVKEHTQGNTFVNTKQVLYCIQKRNVTSIHLTDGSTYLRYNSMNDLEELLGREEFLRISRNVIVQKKRILQLNGINVEMEGNDDGESISLEVGISYMEMVEEYMEQLISERFWSEAEIRNPKIELVYQYIKKHPNCKIEKICNGCHLAEGTLKRYLTVLKHNKRVEYRGSKKLGGYYAIKPNEGYSV